MLHQTRERALALTAAEKGQKHSAEVINPRDERWNEQSSKLSLELARALPDRHCISSRVLLEHVGMLHQALAMCCPMALLPGLLPHLHR